MSLLSTKRTAIIGLGASGLSAARFLSKKGEAFFVLDTRTDPSGLGAFKEAFPDVPVELGPLDAELLCSVNEIVVSPGVAKSTPAIQQAESSGVSVIGDIELFCRDAQAPIIAITGSNAKSTVTTLVYEMLLADNQTALIGGNIGIPALDLLEQPVPDWYVLELSSFQLETTSKLSAKIATVLNMSEDHMDRYASIMQYHAAKQRVYFGVHHIVYNRTDPLTSTVAVATGKTVSFGANQPDLKDFGVTTDDGKQQISRGPSPIMPVADIKMAGSHNVDNALAAIALASLADVSREAMIAVLTTFTGLPHRCQWVAEYKGVTYINDSKGTNVGATVAAIQGLAPAGHTLWLLAGGDAKGAGFSPLKAALEKVDAQVLVFGKDAASIQQSVGDVVPVEAVALLDAAVLAAAQKAQTGDVVLLSPACASLDMFRNYEARGDAFVAAVEALSC